MKELYNIDISHSTISRITDKILPIVRPLEEVCDVVWTPFTIMYGSEGRIVKRVAYIALGIDINGRKMY